MKDINRIAQELFDKIHSRFGNTSIGDDNARSTDDPVLARFYNFDYMDNTGENFGNVTISIVDTNSLKVYFGKSLSQNMNTKQKKNWYQFLKELRHFAKRNLLKFDARDISRSGLNYKDIRQSSKVDSPYEIKDLQLGESLVFGNDKLSYQTLGPIKIIVRHKKPFDMTQTRSRSRNIKDIFFQNTDGEKFKCPYNNLTVARAIGNHLAQNGKINDEGYNHILQMVESLKKINGFIRRAKFENYSDPEVVGLVAEAQKEYSNGKSILRRLTKTRHYESALNEIKTMFRENTTQEEDMSHIRKKLTKQVLDHRIESALPSISAIYHKKKNKNQALIDNNKWLLDKILINSIAEDISVYESSVKYNSLDQLVEYVLTNLERKLDEHNLSEYRSQCQTWKENYSKLENLTEKNVIGKFVLEVLKQAKNKPNKKIVEFSHPINIVDQIIKEEYKNDEVDIDELQNLLDSPLEFGADGDNAVGALSEIIDNLDDSDELKTLLYKESQNNPNDDARQLINYFFMD